MRNVYGGVFLGETLQRENEKKRIRKGVLEIIWR